MIVRLEGLYGLLPGLDGLAVDGFDVLCLLDGDFGSFAAVLGSVLAFGLVAAFSLVATLVLLASFLILAAILLLVAAFVLLATFLLFAAILVLLVAAFGLVASFLLVLATLGLAALVVMLSGGLEDKRHAVAVDLYAGHFGTFDYIGAFLDGGFVNLGVVSYDCALKHAAVGAEELLYLGGLLGSTCNERCGRCKEKQNLFHVIIDLNYFFLRIITSRILSTGSRMSISYDSGV